MAGRIGIINTGDNGQASSTSISNSSSSNGGRIGIIKPTGTPVYQSNQIPTQTYTPQPEKPKDTGLLGFLGGIGSGIGGGILKGGAGALGSVGSLASSLFTGSAENDFTKGTQDFQSGISQWQNDNGANQVGDFIGNLPGGIVSGLVDPASYFVRGARNTPEMIAASLAAGSNDKNVRQEGINTQKLLQEKLYGKDVTKQGDLGMALEGLAQPASAILNVATGGIAGGAEKQIVKQGIKDVAKTALKAGAVNIAAGTPISVAQQLARGQEVTPESIAKDAITQGALGAALGGIPKAINLKKTNSLAKIKDEQNLGKNTMPEPTAEQTKSVIPEQPNIENVKAKIKQETGIKLTDNQAANIVENAPKPAENPISKSSTLEKQANKIEDKPVTTISKVETPIEVPKIDAPKTPEQTQFNSRVFDRMKAEHPELEGEAIANHIKLKEDIVHGTDILAKDKQEAYNIAMGKTQSSDVTSTSMNIIMSQKAMDEGNWKLASQLEINRSLAQTRRGQEIVSEKNSITNNSTSRYVKEVIANRLDKLSKKYLSDIGEVVGKESSKEKSMAVIDKQVATLETNIKTKKLDVKTAVSLLEKMRCL